MTVDFAKNLLENAKRIQEISDTFYKPPSESAPSRDQPILPLAMFKRCRRRYIVTVAHQINSTYSVASYDACTVMIRRLIETLIVEVYEHHNALEKIQDENKEIRTLKSLVDIVTKEPKWNLSRNSKKALDAIKNYGDLSAHSRRFNAHREYIEQNIRGIQVVTQELLVLADLS